MSKEGNQESRFDEAEQLGRNNKRLVSSVKGWCKHLRVEAKAGSLMGEMLGISMSTSIGCPHGHDGFSGANLEWNARDYIIQNCLDCPHHSPLSADNFGIAVVHDYQVYLEKKTKEENDTRERKASLMAEAAKLIAKEKTSAEVKKLSIMNLVQTLDDPEQRKEVVVKIEEASKLSPEFFSVASVDFLCMFIDGEDGLPLLNALSNVQESGLPLSVFALTRITDAIENGVHADIAAKIWSFSVPDQELAGNEQLLSKILENCDYDHFWGSMADRAGSYPWSVRLFTRLHEVDPGLYTRIISAQLKIEEKSTRININGLLTDIAARAPAKVTGFTALLIRSFEFKDPDHGMSGDHATGRTLQLLYGYNQELVWKEMDTAFGKLSDWAKAELIKVYQDILEDEEQYFLSAAISGKMSAFLKNLLLDKTASLKTRTDCLETLRSLADKRPGCLTGYCEAFLGYLVEVNQERMTFNWYREDLGAATRASATFNPLLGKDGWDIEGMQTELDQKLMDTEELVGNLVKAEPDAYFTMLVEVIENLSSKTDGQFKSRIILLLMTALQDTVNISQVLPYIYKYIYDPDSEHVRDSGMQYVTHIFEDFPVLATQNLVDTVKIFLKDPSITVRRRAIEAYRSLLRSLPGQNEESSLDLIGEYVNNNYVVIQKAAAKLSRAAYPFLTPEKRKKWVRKLMILEMTYFDQKDFRYGWEVAQDLLFMAAEIPRVYRALVQETVVKYCNCKEYYTEQSAFSRLTAITRMQPDFQETWLKETIGFLSRTRPEATFGDHDERRALIDFLYTVNEDIMASHTGTFVAYVKDRIDQKFMADIVDAYSILAFFSLWEALHELTGYFKVIIPETGFLIGSHKYNRQMERIAATEARVKSRTLDKTYIQTLV